MPMQHALNSKDDLVAAAVEAVRSYFTGRPADAPTKTVGERAQRLLDEAAADLRRLAMQREGGYPGRESNGRPLHRRPPAQRA